jgi:hypothetical protein
VPKAFQDLKNIKVSKLTSCDKVQSFQIDIWDVGNFDIDSYLLYFTQSADYGVPIY